MSLSLEGILLESFESLDSDVLEYLVTMLCDELVEVEDRRAAAIDFVLSAKGQEYPTVEEDSAVRRVVDSLLLPVAKASPAAVTPIAMRKLSGGAISNDSLLPPRFTIPSLHTHIEALPELTMAMLLSDWLHEEEWVRCARASKFLARRVQEVLVDPHHHHSRTQQRKGELCLHNLAQRVTGANLILKEDGRTLGSNSSSTATTTTTTTTFTTMSRTIPNHPSSGHQGVTAEAAETIRSQRAASDVYCLPVRRQIPLTTMGAGWGSRRRQLKTLRMTDDLLVCKMASAPGGGDAYGGPHLTVFDRVSGACLAPSISLLGELEALASHGHVLVLALSGSSSRSSAVTISTYDLRSQDKERPQRSRRLQHLRCCSECRRSRRGATHGGGREGGAGGVGGCSGGGADFGARSISSSSNQQRSGGNAPTQPIATVCERSGRVLSLDLSPVRCHTGTSRRSRNACNSNGGGKWGECGGGSASCDHLCAHRQTPPAVVVNNGGEGKSYADNVDCIAADDDDGPGNLLLLSATSHRQGKKITVKSRLASTLKPIAVDKLTPPPASPFPSSSPSSSSSSTSHFSQAAPVNMSTLEIPGGAGGLRFEGLLRWGAVVVVAMHGVGGGGSGGDDAVKSSVSVWRIAPHPKAAAAAEAAVDEEEEGGRLHTVEGCWENVTSQCGVLWPRRVAQVAIRCSNGRRHRGGGGDHCRRGWSTRQRLLVYSKEACPQVSVWSAGEYSKPVANFRLALSPQGELLTHHIVSNNTSNVSALVLGKGATILDGATCGELLVLLTSDACVRCWRVDTSSTPAGCVLGNGDNLPTCLVKLNWGGAPLHSAHLAVSNTDAMNWGEGSCFFNGKSWNDDDGNLHGGGNRSVPSLLSPVVVNVIANGATSFRKKTLEHTHNRTVDGTGFKSTANASLNSRMVSRHEWFSVSAHPSPTQSWNVPLPPPPEGLAPSAPAPPPATQRCHGTLEAATNATTTSISSEMRQQASQHTTTPPRLLCHCGFVCSADVTQTMRGKRVLLRCPATLARKANLEFDARFYSYPTTSSRAAPATAAAAAAAAADNSTSENNDNFKYNNGTSVLLGKIFKGCTASFWADEAIIEY